MKKIKSEIRKKNLMKNSFNIGSEEVKKSKIINPIQRVQMRKNISKIKNTKKILPIVNKIDDKIDETISVDNLSNLELTNESNYYFNWRKGQSKNTDKTITFTVSSYRTPVRFTPRGIRINRNRAPIVKVVDLRKLLPSIYDQGELGSCTANAVCASYIYNVNKQNEKLFDPSRLFVYYNSRMIDGSIDEDAGSTLQDSMKALNKYGVCEEKYYPYIISQFREKPSEEAYNDGLNHQSIIYKRVTQNLAQLKECISNGFPFVFGFLVFSSFMSSYTANTGIMSMPRSNEQIFGGHAVLACGFDDQRQAFIVRNSWGSKWGVQGYFYMPYSFITNSRYCADFWTVELVE